MQRPGRCRIRLAGHRIRCPHLEPRSIRWNDFFHVSASMAALPALSKGFAPDGPGQARPGVPAGRCSAGRCAPTPRGARRDGACRAMAVDGAPQAAHHVDAGPLGVRSVGRSRPPRPTARFSSRSSASISTWACSARTGSSPPRRRRLRPAAPAAAAGTPAWRWRQGRVRGRRRPGRRAAGELDGGHLHRGVAAAGRVAPGRCCRATGHYPGVKQAPTGSVATISAEAPRTRGPADGSRRAGDSWQQRGCRPRRAANGSSPAYVSAGLSPRVAPPRRRRGGRGSAPAAAATASRGPVPRPHGRGGPRPDVAVECGEAPSTSSTGSPAQWPPPTLSRPAYGSSAR